MRTTATTRIAAATPRTQGRYRRGMSMWQASRVETEKRCQGVSSVCSVFPVINSQTSQRCH
eukprot:15028091-Heterocapsa_arctica.AAC.1